MAASCRPRGLAALLKIEVRENENSEALFAMLPRGCPQPSPQCTQVSQAIAMSGAEHIRATPRCWDRADGPGFWVAL